MVTCPACHGVTPLSKVRHVGFCRLCYGSGAVDDEVSRRAFLDDVQFRATERQWSQSVRDEQDTPNRESRADIERLSALNGGSDK